MKIIIKGGKVWNGEAFEYKDILTHHEKIEKIAEHIECDVDYVYDAKGKIVSAGLVDAHVHMKGISPDIYGIPADMSSIPFGVTSSCDAGAIQGDKNLLDTFLTNNCVYAFAEIKDNSLDRAQLEHTLSLYGDKAVGVKISFDTANPHILDINPLKEVREFAGSKGLKVLVHTTGSPVPMTEIAKTLKSGDTITHVFHGGKNTVEEDDFEAFKLAKSRGIYLDVGFAGHVHTDFGILRHAVEKGFLPDIISTDITCASAFRRGGRYGITMCMSIAKDVGMNETDIFRAVTSTPAKSLGRENEWGYLKEGRCADISVFDYNDEAYSLTDKSGNTVENKKSYKCTLCVCKGLVVYR